jgi:hypothetical protein
MSKYSDLQKIIKKGKKIETPDNLQDSLLSHISSQYHEDINRELNFLTLYYGLQGNALTLESIGQAQENPLTRERVRQIIDSVLDPLIKISHANNPYINSIKFFNEILGEKKFLRLDELFENSYFSSFKKNIKGLISFLNDCDIRQIAYRKNYYFYPVKFKRQDIINEIQKENKHFRREKTLEKMSHKAKTVTYVPDEIRQHLLDYAEKTKSNLNPMYENILKDFIAKKPYETENYEFSKTKSWKARKGKAQWQQIGIYIEKDIFELIKENVKFIKIDLNKKVSLMSFICQAFVWHCETHKT